VAGHEHGCDLGLADVEGFAVVEQVVELAAVGQKAALQVVELLEGGLHLADVVADADAPADALLQVARTREVVGVRVGLEDPVDVERVVLQVRQHLVGGGRVGVGGFEVVVEHRVDDGGAARGAAPHHVRDRPRLGVKEGLGGGACVHECGRCGSSIY
jgi:hypothetical protein